MECRTCKFSKIDNVKADYSEEIHKELCCHRYAPRMVHGAGTGFSNWRYPQTSPDDFCGEHEESESE